MLTLHSCSPLAGLIFLGSRLQPPRSQTIEDNEIDQQALLEGWGCRKSLHFYADFFTVYTNTHIQLESLAFDA